MDSISNDRTGSYVFMCLRKHCRGTVPDANTSLSELNLDSLDLIEGIYELENHYGTTLSNAELAKLTTVADLLGAFSTPTKQS